MGFIKYEKALDYMKDNQKRITKLQKLISAWEQFDKDIPEEFGKDVWRVLGPTINLYRSELNALEGLEKYRGE
jgi:hypothetical protein